jgi:hypothetical protein
MEKRVNQRLLHYWEEQRGARRFPAETDINPDELEDIWDDMFLLQVSPDPEREQDYHYSYMGQHLIDAFGENMTGEDVCEALLSTYRETIIRDLNKVVENSRPILQEGAFENVHHMRIKYRRILCPLGPTDETVDHIIGAMRWMAV